MEGLSAPRTDALPSLLQALAAALIIGVISAYCRPSARLSKAEAQARKAVARFMQYEAPALLLHQQSYAALLPTLRAAPCVRCADVRAGDLLDVRRFAEGAFTIVALPEALLARARSLADRHARMEVADEQLTRGVLEALVTPLLPRVHADGYGRALSLGDCLLVGLGMERGAPFPLIHTDTEWDLFPRCEGFQLWYLLDLDSRRAEEGQMFMASAEAADVSDPPTAFYLRPASADGASVLKVRNDGGDAPAGEPTYGEEKPLLGRYDSLADCGFSFAYAALRPGECLLMNKRQLHMSDPRPHLSGRPVDRRALTLRVVLRPPGVRPDAELMDTSCAAYAGKALPRVIIGGA